MENDTLNSQRYAVNIMLQSIGELPLNDDIELPNAPQYILAVNILEEIKKNVLSEEWDCNTDKNYKLAVNSDKQIPVPCNVLNLYSTAKQYTIRNGFIYNKDNLTDRFDGENVEVTIVWDLDFDSLPYALKYYIAIKSARVYASRVLVEATAVKYSSDDENAARVSALRADTRARKNNMLDSYFGISASARS